MIKDITIDEGLRYSRRHEKRDVKPESLGSNEVERPETEGSKKVDISPLKSEVVKGERLVGDSKKKTKVRKGHYELYEKKPKKWER